MYYVLWVYETVISKTIYAANTRTHVIQQMKYQKNVKIQQNNSNKTYETPLKVALQNTILYPKDMYALPPGELFFKFTDRISS